MARLSKNLVFTRNYTAYHNMENCFNVAVTVYATDLLGFGLRNLNQEKET